MSGGARAGESSRPAVFVRGLGAVTPLGPDWPSSWAALVRGECAIRPVSHFDVEGFPSTVASAVVDPPAFGVARRVGAGVVEGRGVADRESEDRGAEGRGAEGRGVADRESEDRGVADRESEDREPEDRRTPMALSAAREAWGRADVSAPAERIGIFVGAESARPRFSTVIALARWASERAGGSENRPAAVNGERSTSAAVARALDSADGRFGGSAARLASVSPAAVAAALAKLVGAHGPAQTICLACASSAVAIAEGARAIEQGRCDLALCGGVGADVDPFMMAGFGLLGALSATGISRPFDARRDGFVLGEAAVFVVLAREAGSAAVRLLGSGRSLDAHHITSPDPTGAGAERAMRQALVASGLERVDVVQAHGTSTLLNDAVEAAALNRVFAATASPAVSSVKGALGHTIAAAGALGVACATSSLEQGLVPPTVGLEQVDVDCPLNHVRGEVLWTSVRSAMVNAFAFGGANCSLVLARA